MANPSFRWSRTRPRELHPRRQPNRFGRGGATPFRVPSRLPADDEARDEVAVGAFAVRQDTELGRAAREGGRGVAVERRRLEPRRPFLGRDEARDDLLALL